MDHGDRLIQAAGEVLGKAAKSHEGMGYRLSGDMFLFTLASPEDAYEFLRDAVDAFKEFAPIGMYGFASFSAGLGTTFGDAEAALEKAKQAKVERHGDLKANLGAEWGHGKSYVYSNIGAPGLVPMDEEPEIPLTYTTPKRIDLEAEETPQPMQLRPPNDRGWPQGAPDEGQAREPADREERSFSKSEKKYGVPDFVREAQDDAPSDKADR
jgi:hypothetical protein